MRESAPREVRDLVLVKQGFQFEIKAIKNLGINIMLTPSITEILDTTSMALETFGKKFQPSLGRIIVATGLRGESLHNAGNDANYT